MLTNVKQIDVSFHPCLAHTEGSERRVRPHCPRRTRSLSIAMSFLRELRLIEVRVPPEYRCPSLRELLLPQSPVLGRRSEIRKCLFRLSWCICLVSAMGFISFRCINTLTYNYATATEIGYLTAPRLHEQIEQEHPLHGSNWAEWQSLGVVPWHWTETTHLCMSLQCSIEAHACRILSLRDLGRWFLSLRIASRRCRRHALMAVMHMVHGAIAADAVASARSRRVGTMQTLFVPFRTAANKRR